MRVYMSKNLRYFIIENFRVINFSYLMLINQVFDALLCSKHLYLTHLTISMVIMIGQN